MSDLNENSENEENTSQKVERITKGVTFDPVSLDIIERACKLEGRNFSNFMAYASLKMARHILADELDSPEGQE